MRKRIVRTVVATSAMAVFGLFAASPASAASASCSSGGGVCTSSSIPANGNHQVCFGGQHTALSYWGRAELWDADTGVMVGSIATNPFRWQQACTGGLYGAHYYLRGTGNQFYGEVWN
ncbi:MULTISPECIES: hypothetical protein [unclassified Streptomyces]|uniref:hypothetical protein n=1 Tax=Streptomycetaceae TaxID=2062 RepID=UPI002E783954|nr:MULTISPECIES: hypothetical protein [unclassified Streptomyces]MED7949224.1 hypothetical protein [Streptomyces sp. BE303]MEE1821719.1 hypothetical protein [Streptomyces sp. BE20]